MGLTCRKPQSESPPVEAASSTSSSTDLHSSPNQPSNDSPGKEFLLQDHQKIEPRTERYQKVFTTYYAKLCDALPVEEILPYLVSSELITVREMDDVLAEKTSFRKAQALLNGPIWRAISGGYPEAFVTLLCVLNYLHSCVELCEEICTSLNISAEVIISESRKFYNYVTISLYMYACILCWKWNYI